VNLSAISRDSLIGKVLRAPLALIPPSTVVPILQGPLRGRRWVVGSGTHGCWLGSYEHRKHRRFADWIRSGATVFDVGANVGFYTLLASARCGPHGRVFAFEPDRRNVAFLARHLLLNRSSNVTIVEAAVGDATGMVRFAPGANPSMGSVSETGTVEVPSVSLDALVFEGQAPAPDVIKMDIEGGEVRALAGARRVLEAHRPTIFLATHGPQAHQICCSLLGELGYVLEAIDGRRLGETDELLARAPGSYADTGSAASASAATSR
jgi:FkbM family methyltransferase